VEQRTVVRHARKTFYRNSGTEPEGKKKRKLLRKEKKAFARHAVLDTTHSRASLSSARRGEALKNSGALIMSWPGALRTATPYQRR